MNLRAILFSDVCISCPRLVPLGNITPSTKESRPNAKRPRQSNLSDQSSPVSKRFKTATQKPSPDAKARRIVEGYDEELTCPLCVFCSSVNAIKVNITTQMLRLLVSFDRNPKALGIIYGVLSVATHVANPCGHSICGPCIAEWIKVFRHRTIGYSL